MDNGPDQKAFSSEPTTEPALSIDNLRPIWLPGAEDIVIDQQTGWAYIASQARPPGGLPAIMRLQGALYGLDLKQDHAVPVNLTDLLFAQGFFSPDAAPAQEAGGESEPLVRPKGSFHPRGISLFKGEDGSRRLFVINHRTPTRMTVEIFDVEEDRLTHRRTVADDRFLISANDLVAVGAEQFYATNDHGFVPLLQPLETVLHYLPHLDFGSIVYFDGTSFRRVAERLAFPNGIAVDRKAGWLYVASSWGRQLLVARWREDKPEEPLTFTREIPLQCAPDNLEWDADGNLWVGAHQDMATLGLYLFGMVEKSPSLAIRLSKPDADAPAKAVWRDDGTRLSSSSVVAAYKRAEDRTIVLIGSAFDDRLLMGDLSSSRGKTS
jgi:arylesterase / paraoxonase